LTSPQVSPILERRTVDVNEDTKEEVAIMDFWDRVKTTIDKGLEGSRDILGKARDKAQDLGERGVLRVEIVQLENQAEKLVGKLGAVAYEALVVDKKDQVNNDSPGVQELIDEMNDVRARITEKESLLELAKRKESGQ
jgi:hypothetical protein